MLVVDCVMYYHTLHPCSHILHSCSHTLHPCSHTLHLCSHTHVRICVLLHNIITLCVSPQALAMVIFLSASFGYMSAFSPTFGWIVFLRCMLGLSAAGSNQG